MKSDRRRVTLFDVMALIAATAIGLSLSQVGWPRGTANPAVAWVFTLPIVPKLPGYPSRTWMLPVAERVAPWLPCLAAWSGAFLATRLHAPRPRRRRLVLQPGFVAAVAVLFVVTTESILLVGSSKHDGRFGGATPARIAEFASNATVLLAHHAGWAVAVGWLTLAVTGRWRPEPSWVDRWGRGLGLTWIVVGLATSLLIDHVAWWGNFLGP